MNDRLEYNLLSLPEYALNSEVKDLPTRINDRVSVALQYACRSWHNHLTETGEDLTDVIGYLRTFLEQKFLAWLEVVSVLGAVNGAVAALEKLIPWLREVAKDNELLATARDFFRFVTKFFEPINASAPHIYHSALELCPTSSMVRKLYYDRCDRITRLPRVVVGTPDLWDRTAAIAFRFDHECKEFIWSPCGQFIAARTDKVIKIWDQLTLELLTTLRPTAETVLPREGPLAYSPDGRCIACVSSTVIIVWDIQTGGVVKEKECRINPHSLVWSLDGSKIGAVEWDSNVHTYEVVSGTILSHGKLYSGDKKIRFRLVWAHETSFRAVTVVSDRLDDHGTVVDIFEIGSALAKLHSFPLVGDPELDHSDIFFSPSTFRVSVSSGKELCIFGDRGSSYLLRIDGCFSSDGNFFAASSPVGDVFFWEYIYTSNHYILWRQLQNWDWDVFCLRFSPNLSSVMGSNYNQLVVCRLDDLPTHPPHNYPYQYASLTRTGNRIATAYESERTVTILNIHSPTPLQFIDTGVEITRMGIIGDVLLVMSLEKTAAWVLTKEGLVKGVVGNRRADHSDSIWNVPGDHYNLLVCAATPGKVVKVFEGHQERENVVFAFHGETGKLLLSPFQHSSGPEVLSDQLGHEYHLNYSNLLSLLAPLQGDCNTSRPELRQGWIEDPEGGCRMWIPGQWQSEWDSGDWDHNTSTMRMRADKHIIIKF